MPQDTEILAILGELETKAPVGYALAFHIHFTAPRVLLQTYPKAWTDYYSQNGLVMSDPTVAWGFENDGACRWSDLPVDDAAGVLTQAATHGLAYGVIIVVDQNDSRSLCSLAHDSREFTDAEIAQFTTLLQRLHGLTHKSPPLSDKMIQQLKNMSVRLTLSRES